MQKTKILFVCLGNICRSPLAEAIFKHKIKELGQEDLFEVDSCGTANYHLGQSPDSRTIRNALKNGVQLNHSVRQLCQKDLGYYDYIFAMDRSNYHNILRLPNAEQHVAKIKLMREFDPESTGGEVPDPYYGGESSFQEVFEILERSIDNLLQHMQQVAAKH